MQGVKKKKDKMDTDQVESLKQDVQASVSDFQKAKSSRSHTVGSKIADRYMLLQELEDRPHGHGGPIEESGALREPLRFKKGDEPLGQGTYATAYLAKDTHHKGGKVVVLKILNEDMSDDLDAQQRTSDECDVMKSLQDGATSDPLGASRFLGCIENHITIDKKGLGRDQFLVLEFGGQVVDKDAGLDVVEMVKQTMQGVTYLATLQKAHRALKPSNILVSYGRTGETIIKIMNFGVHTGNTKTQAKVACQGSRCMAESLVKGQYVYNQTGCLDSLCPHIPDESPDCVHNWRTYLYAPPEMRDDRQKVCLPTTYPVDAFDVWSIGTIAVELVCHSKEFAFEAIGKGLHGVQHAGQIFSESQCVSGFMSKPSSYKWLYDFCTSALKEDYQTRGRAVDLLQNFDKYSSPAQEAEELAIELEYARMTAEASNIRAEFSQAQRAGLTPGGLEQLVLQKRLKFNKAQKTGWKHGWWSAYLGVCLFATCNQFLLVACATAWSLKAFRDRNKKILDVTERVTAVVPCYLPNEAPIIKETIQHLLTAFTHISKLDVLVVYNTPTNMEIEEDLQQMTKAPMPDGRRLFVQRVMQSNSKAENMNYVIPDITSKFTVIYDADHHPDPNSLAMAVNLLDEGDIDCVQGSTYIRHGHWWMRYVIHGEFFLNYFVSLVGVQLLTGSGFFGGSNGIWLTSSLKQLPFDDQLLTEDIDCSARALTANGFRFIFLPQCMSGELAPSNLQSFWRQRLRWTMGWDQVMLKNVPSFWRSKLSMRKRLGLYWMFTGRWFMIVCACVFFIHTYILAFGNARALPCYAWSPLDDVVNPLASACTPPRVQFVRTASFTLGAFMSCLALLNAWVFDSKRYTVWSVALYLLCLPLHGFLQIALFTISLLRNARGNVGEWVCTTRMVQDLSKSDVQVIKAFPVTGKNQQ